MNTSVRITANSGDSAISLAALDDFHSPNEIESSTAFSDPETRDFHSLLDEHSRPWPGEDKEPAGDSNNATNSQRRNDQDLAHTVSGVQAIPPPWPSARVARPADDASSSRSFASYANSHEDRSRAQGSADEDSSAPSQGLHAGMTLAGSVSAQSSDSGQVSGSQTDGQPALSGASANDLSEPDSQAAEAQTLAASSNNLSGSAQTTPISQDEPDPQTSSSSYGLEAQPEAAAQLLASLVLQPTIAAGLVAAKTGAAPSQSIPSTGRPAAREGGAEKSRDLFSLNGATFGATPDAEDASSTDAQADGTASSGQQTGSSLQWNLETGDPRIETSHGEPPASSGAIAFEAKLSPVPAAPDNTGNDVQQTLPATGQLAPAQPAGWSPAESNNVTVREIADPKLETLFKTDPFSTPTSTAAVSSAPSRTPTAAPADLSAMSRMEPLIENPKAPAGSGHSITVKIPDAAGESAIDLRFVDRGGDIHVSVRTPDAEVAHELRGGLNDLAARLEHAGLRTEVSSPSANGSPAQRDTQDGSPERRGSGRNQSDPQNQGQDSRNSSRGRWAEAFEDSAGDQVQSGTFSKEQNT
jgi:hypothetical protein